MADKPDQPTCEVPNFIFSIKHLRARSALVEDFTGPTYICINFPPVQMSGGGQNDWTGSSAKKGVKMLSKSLINYLAMLSGIVCYITILKCSMHIQWRNAYIVLMK